MRLADLLPSVARAASEDSESCSADEILELLVFARDGGGLPSGRALEVPGVYENGVLVAPLSGETHVPDSLLVFDLIGHYPLWTLRPYRTMQALESHVAAMYVNQFTTAIVVVHEGVVRPFEVTYLDPAGNRCIYRKREHLYEDFAFSYPEPRVTWPDGRNL